MSSEDRVLAPILDTGATNCLLPLIWLEPERAAKSKRLHLKVASGTSVRALLYQNLIYCVTVSRPLLSVGQLKGMLDLRRDDAAPSLVACSIGLKHILLEASVVHHLLVVTHSELNMLLKAIQAFTEDGSLWNAAHWSKELGRKLQLFHRAGPTKVLPD